MNFSISLYALTLCRVAIYSILFNLFNRHLKNNNTLYRIVSPSEPIPLIVISSRARTHGVLSLNKWWYFYVYLHILVPLIGKPTKNQKFFLSVSISSSLLVGFVVFLVSIWLIAEISLCLSSLWWWEWDEHNVMIWEGIMGDLEDPKTIHCRIKIVLNQLRNLLLSIWVVMAYRVWSPLIVI